MTDIRGMLFDLDGTLLDSAPDLVASLNHVRETERLAPLPLADMKPYASKGALGLLRAGMPATDSVQLETWRQRFLAHYSDNSFRHSTLFEGVPDLLEFLDDAGIPWGIVTNKIERLTLPIVEIAGLAERVSCIVCGDTLAESKPHPAPVWLACEMIGVSPGETVFVGDDVRDVQAGVAAGTMTAAVFYGYGSGELQESGVTATFAVYHPADLVDVVEKHGDRERPRGE